MPYTAITWKRCINPECWRLFEFDRILNKSDRLCPGCYQQKTKESPFKNPKKYAHPPKPPNSKERLIRVLDELISEGKPFFLTELSSRAGVTRSYLNKKELKEFRLRAIAASNELRQVENIKLPDDPVKVAIEQELQQPLNNVDYYTAQLSLEEKRWANHTRAKSKAS